MNKRMILKILGTVVILGGVFMTLPMIVALIYKEESGLCFIPSAALSIGVGLLSRLIKTDNNHISAKEGFIIVSLSWIILSLIGAVPFTLSGEIPNYLDAVFETVSGYTTTGASILNDVEALSHCMVFWRSFTHWLGGMGILVFLLALLPQSGGQSIHLLRAESPGPTVSKMVPKMRTSSAILYGIYLALTVLQFIFYIFGGMPVFDAVCLAIGTAGTGGFAIKNTSLAGYSMYLQGVTTVFMALFGINFSLYFLLLRKRFKAAFSNSELKFYIGIILSAITLITANVLYVGKGAGSVFKTLHHVAFSVVSLITTTGYCTEDFNLWPEFSKVILILLMMTGACAGSTGGGLKVSRVLILVKSAVIEVRRALHPHTVQAIKLNGKKVQKENANAVCVYLIVYISIIVISILLISLDNHDTSTTITSVIATVNNIGPGLGDIGPSGNFSIFSPMSKIVLTFDMLFGRLELFPMLILLMPSTWRRHLHRTK